MSDPLRIYNEPRVHEDYARLYEAAAEAAKIFPRTPSAAAVPAILKEEPTYPELDRLMHMHEGITVAFFTFWPSDPSQVEHTRSSFAVTCLILVQQYEATMARYDQAAPGAPKQEAPPMKAMLVFIGESYHDQVRFVLGNMIKMLGA